MAAKAKPPVHVGLPPGSVRVVPYDPEWPGEFRRIRKQLFPLFPRARIEHVGSTSVVGCAAKPIIDVSVGLPKGGTLHVEDARAVGLEFRSVRPYSVVFAFSNPDGIRKAHVHVRPRNSTAELRDLLFRDYLRAHPKTVLEYSKVKRRLAALERIGADYTRAKTPFIDRTLEQARQWAEKTGWSPPS